MTDSTDSSDSRKRTRNARDPFSQCLKSMSGRRGPGFLSLLREDLN